jgi:RNA polymerase sigma factor (sigma-70 family)
MTLADRTLQQVSDQELVARARAGDRAAFAVLFERHRPVAAALIARILDRRQDVDDVLQEAAVQALVCLGRLQEAARFGPWLCGIASNLARRQLRESARQPKPAPRQAGRPSTEELLEEAETAAKVRRAVETLPRGQREAVQLFYLDGLNEGEVATELGIARTAVKSRLHKARRALSGHLPEERRATVPRLSLVDVDVVDVRREPEAVPGGGRAHVVVLEERAGDRALHIFIGEPEGRAMASTLTGFQTPRPMTYQLAASLVAALSGSVDEVRVVRLSENTYIAEVLLAGPSGTKVVDARPSDAINLALLTGAPVRVASDVLDQWATASERADLDEYPDDAQAIRADLGSFFPASLDQLAPDAAEVIVVARQEAINRAHRAVGTGHILLAVLRRSTPEQLAVQGLCVAAVQNALDGEPSSSTPSEAPPLSPRVLQVLMRAQRRAASRPDPKPSADDLFVALLDQRGGTAAHLLDEASVDGDAVQAMLGGD